MKIIRKHFGVLTLIGILLNMRSEAQSNMINFQLLGDGLLLSVKYERKVLPDFNLWLSGGMGYYFSEVSYLTIPLGLKYWQPLSKSKRNYIGLGASVTYCKHDELYYPITSYRGGREKPANNYLYYIPALGFRHMDAKGQKFYTWEVSLVANNFAVLPYFGYSIGFTF